jgi:EF hand
MLLLCTNQTQNRIFKAFDRDNSGGVSYSEFIAFVLHCDINIVKSSNDYGDSDSDDSSINGSYTKRYTIALPQTTCITVRSACISHGCCVMCSSAYADLTFSSILT